MENIAYAASTKLTDAKCSDIFKRNSFPRKAPKFDTQKTLPNGPGISLQTHEKGSVTFHVVQREYFFPNLSTPFSFLLINLLNERKNPPQIQLVDYVVL